MSSEKSEASIAPCPTCGEPTTDGGQGPCKCDPLCGKIADIGSELPAGKRSGIYIASKAKHGPRWQALRASGVPIVSTWIDESGEGETSDWSALWDRCIDEASTCAAMVVYVEAGEVCKGSLVEVGAALHAGVPVFWVGPEYSTAPRHRGVRRFASLDEAIEAASLIRTTLDALTPPAVPDGEALPALAPEHTPPAKRAEGEVWRGRVKIDDDWVHVAVVSADGSTLPVFYWYGHWREPSHGLGCKVMTAWALAQRAAGRSEGEAERARLKAEILNNDAVARESIEAAHEEIARLEKQICDIEEAHRVDMKRADDLTNIPG